MRRLLLQPLLPLLLCFAVAAHAGQNCSDQPLLPEAAVKSLDLAQRSLQALDDSGAQIAVIARVGQDLSKYGLHYSHVGLVWRDHPAGRWTVIHELNDCGTANSALYNDGLANFFLDDLFRYEAQIMVPSAPTQARLAALLAGRTPRRLHERKYNMLSYVFSTQYQNSNQWVLETYAAARAPEGQVETRTEAQQWLQSTQFRPVTVEVPASTRLGGRMFRANIAFDDHPFERRMAGHIDTVTVDALLRYMVQSDPQTKVLTVPAL
jgi:hypothetical protein